MSAACRQLWDKAPTVKDAIAGVALTTQRATVINVDGQGRPLRPAILWLDQRRTEGQRPLGGPWGIAFKLSRMSETIAYIQAEAEANWIRSHEPEISTEYVQVCLPVRLPDLSPMRALCRFGGLPGWLHAV